MPRFYGCVAGVVHPDEHVAPEAEESGRKCELCGKRMPSFTHGCAKYCSETCRKRARALQQRKKRMRARGVKECAV